MWKEFIRQYLRFTRRERTGIYALLILSACFIIIPWCYPFFISAPPPPESDSAREELLARIAFDSSENDHGDEYGPGQERSRKYGPASDYNHQSNASLFPFNPNSLDADGWRKLGLREKTITTILNYRSKGGSFRRAEDLKRVYGLREDEYSRLEPYIQLEPPASFPGRTANMPYPANPVAERKPVVLDINQADTTAFKSLPGIGSKLSARIVHFREKLGGFYSIAQVAETFGLHDSVFQKIKSRLNCQPVSIKTININIADQESLASHPYIGRALARTIAAYRKQHGPFSSVEGIRSIMMLSDEVYKKLTPYLVVGTTN